MQSPEQHRTQRTAERQQKKVAVWFAGFVVVTVVLALLIAACWYYLGGHKSDRKIPQKQSQLTIFEPRFVSSKVEMIAGSRTRLQARFLFNYVPVARTDREFLNRADVPARKNYRPR
jgi:hypothetical protein